MTTLEPPLLKQTMMFWDSGMDYSSAVFAGIVGDWKHSGKGYHIALEDLDSQNDYSAVRVDDKVPPGTWPRNFASAGDMSMNTSDMVKCWNRFYAVWADKNDSRRIYFNAINGWNGKGEAERLDFKANTRTIASSDHKWHTHAEWCRKYCNDPKAMAAFISMMRGETKSQWNAKSGGFDTVIGGSNTMLMLARTKTNPSVYKGDGIQSDNVATMNVVNNLVAVGAVWLPNFDTEAEMFQNIGTPIGLRTSTVSLSDAQLQVLTEAVAKFPNTTNPDEIIQAMVASPDLLQMLVKAGNIAESS